MSSFVTVIMESCEKKIILKGQALFSIKVEIK